VEEGTSTRPMRLSRLPERFFNLVEVSHSRAVIVLVLASLALFLPGLTGLQPMDRDEPRFAQASKQMLETGDLVDIRFQDEARHKKPVGIYWMQAAVVSTAEALGVADARRMIWLYRVPSQLAAILTVLFTYAAALAFVTRRAALTAALLMAAVVLLGVEARLAKTDAVLTAATTAAVAVLAHVAARRPGDEAVPGWAIFGFWIALGVSILVKGPITPAIVGIAVLGLIWSGVGGERLRALRPRLGLVLLLAMVLPWFVAIMLKSGGSFFTESVGGDMLAKVGSGKERHGAPPGTYIAAFFGTGWPLVPFVLLALPFIWRERRDPGVRFCLFWLVPMWLVFEAVPTKLPHYVLPLYPALAILVAIAAEHGRMLTRGPAPDTPEPRIRFLKVTPTGLRNGGISLLAYWLAVPLALIGLVLAIAPSRLGDAMPAHGFVTLALAVLVAIAAAGALSSGKVGSAALAACLSAVILAITVYGTALPSLSSLRLSNRLARIADSAGCPDLKLASAGYGEPSLVFLTRTDLLIGSGTQAAQFLSGPGCRMAFVEARQREAFDSEALRLGLQPRQRAEVQGLNLNGGRQLAIAVFDTARSDQEGARP
jgi:4-amino-4-deoxy-L-arabinose transferase-like glycosyltransferase